MSASGDSLLLRAGLVRAEQLAEAQRMRTRSGGTVGEWLVRLGAVTEAQLVDFYHKRLLVPRVSPAQLARIPSDVLAAVPAEMASEFRVVPVSIDANRALTIAMADPADTHVAEEVAFYSGRFCHRAVAGVGEILGAIDRHYRARAGGVRLTPGPMRPLPAPGLEAPIPLDRRVVAPAPSPAAKASPAPAIEAADAPVLLTAKKVATPTSPGPLAAANVAQTPASETPVPTPVTDEPSGRRSRFASTQSRIAMKPREAPPEPAEPEPPIPLTQPIAEPPRRRARTLPGLPIVPEVPLERLRTAASRDEVATALLDYAAQIGSGAALLVSRKGLLAGQDARGSLDTEGVRALQLPFDEPSLLRDVMQSRLPYRGPLSPSPPLRALSLLLPPEDDAVDALLLPIGVGERVVAVLMAVGVVAPIADEALHALALEAGAAYERLILSTRR